MAEQRPTDRRHRVGLLGEAEAEGYLHRRGHATLDRRFRARHGEIDLVTSHGRCLVFTEVKARTAEPSTSGIPQWIDPPEAVAAGKQRRLRLAAATWIAAHGGRLPAGLDDVRFDVIGVVIAPDGRVLRIEHLRDAFG